ncbi:GpE family phage tail protein [Escherichia coli]|nr:GpE family phage tail protein [Escherichia coli]
MTLYSGMNNTSGKAITDIDHLRQSVTEVLEWRYKAIQRSGANDE